MMFEEYSDNSILENNLYGVDINEESVEITKLSLWLHTAQKDRKLTTLNNKNKMRKQSDRRPIRCRRKSL